MSKRKGRVVFFKSKNGWRWRVIAANGNVLANSGQGYSRKCDCVRALDIVMYEAELWEREGL